MARKKLTERKKAEMMAAFRNRIFTMKLPELLNEYDKLRMVLNPKAKKREEVYSGNLGGKTDPKKQDT